MDMVRFIMTLIINGFAVYFTAMMVSGVEVSSFWIAMVAAAVLGIVNFILRPILVFLTLPFTILTLGLFLFILNGAMVLLVAWMVPGFEVEGLWPGIVFTVVLWLVNLVLGWLTGGDGKDKD